MTSSVPFLILDVAPGVTMVIVLKELEILEGRGLNEAVFVEVNYWM